MQENIDVTTVDQSLKKIVKGGGLILAGTFLGLAIQFLNKILIVRSISRADYGLLSLGLVLFSIAGAVSQGGFQLSVPRFLGYHRGKGDKERIRGIIRSAFETEISLGFIFSLFFFFGAGFIEDIFQEEGLKIVLIVFAFQLPLFNAIHTCTTVFRGFDNAKPEFYFNKLMLVSVRLLLLFIVVLVGPSLLNVLIAYLGTQVLTAVAAITYYYRKKPESLTGTTIPMRKELLLFSLPLFGTIFMGRLMKWTDVLMLGHFTTADMVGLYNGAIPISELMPVFLSSSGFISIPVLSSLYSQEKFSEMKKTYSIITKWIFSATFPMFLVVFLFPRVVLTFFFGPDYQDASTALRILATGYMFHALMGPNALNLVIFGRANLTMANTTAGLFINVLLNVLLIPLYGINGAAAATAVTYISVNTLSSLEVYIIQRMHPFSRNYVKPLLSSLGLLLLFRILFTYQFDVRYWMLPFLFVLFIIIYCFIILISKSFDREDIMLLKAIESRTGLNISWLRKILRRFL